MIAKIENGKIEYFLWSGLKADKKYDYKIDLKSAVEIFNCKKWTRKKQ